MQVDLQLFQTRRLVIQLCLINFAGVSSNVTLFSSRKILLF